MARIAKEYIRLPGRRYISLSFTRNSLWLGKDHLLHVINRGYTEDYRRFYYRDIQAILIRKTVSGTILKIIFGAIAGINLLLLALGRFVWSWERVALVPLAISSCFWGLLFLADLAAGPTCICHLRTAVQFEPLPSLFRLRKARRAIALLSSRVENAQGSLASEVPSS
jgi:hypothetical protein